MGYLFPKGFYIPLITVIVKQNQIRLVDKKPAIDLRQPGIGAAIKY
ncbi:MAG: hypothetical protein ACHBN1_32500 [Heteroscytonema crispum UTEX LB 1556]